MTYAEFKSKFEALMDKLMALGNTPESWDVCESLGELVDTYPYYERRYDTEGGNKYAG